MEVWKKYLPYWIALALLFSLPPLFIRDTGSGMLVLLFIMPVGCFLVGLISSLKMGFSLYPIIAAMVLYFPTIWIYYNESAAVYTLVFGLMTTLGQGVGAGIHYFREDRGKDKK